VGAKAIAFAAFRRTHAFLGLQMMTQIFTILCMFYFSWHCRQTQGGDGYVNWEHAYLPLHWQCMLRAAFCSFWLKDVIIAMMLFRKFRKYELQMPWLSRIADYSFLIFEIPLVATMLPNGLTEDILRIPPFKEGALRILIAFLGAVIWLRLLVLISGLEVLSLGPRILPIAKTLGEMTPFLFVMTFFFCAAFTVSYAMTEITASSLLLDTYRMAFAGEYARKMFFTSHYLHHQDLQEEDDWGHIEWGFRFFIYSIAGILIMVALNNIFIGIMSSTYDEHQECAWSLFVRHRATWALDYSLLFEECSQDEHLWVCVPVKEEVEQREDHSIHSKMETVKDQLERKLQQILDNLGHLEHTEESQTNPPPSRTRMLPAL